jgi:hypothetical protein
VLVFHVATGLLVSRSPEYGIVFDMDGDKLAVFLNAGEG